MSSEDHSHLEPLAERITRLEELFTHLQQTVLDLNEVVIECQRRVDALDAKILRVVDSIADQAAGPERPFDPEAERPPHY